MMSQVWWLDFSYSLPPHLAPRNPTGGNWHSNILHYLQASAYCKRKMVTLLNSVAAEWHHVTSTLTVYFPILLRLNACVECAYSLQCNVCCDGNLTCACMVSKQPMHNRWSLLCHAQCTNGVSFRLSPNPPHFLEDFLHILHIPCICLHLPGIERTNMKVR